MCQNFSTAQTASGVEADLIFESTLHLSIAEIKSTRTPSQKLLGGTTSIGCALQKSGFIVDRTVVYDGSENAAGRDLVS